MISFQTIDDRLRRAFAPTQRGIVGLTDQMIAAFVDGEVAFERNGDQCTCRWTLNGETQEALAPLSSAVFRTVLARIAKLCNEQSSHTVTPYAGEGVLTINGDPPTRIHVTFVNTPDKQLLELATLSSRVAEENAVENARVVEVDLTVVSSDN